ncbi:MAG: DUF2510 domain-containing protein [Nocardioidaceae bacterium]|nr:MAG: DUF2510 domain-containing protein [Nocardioidaceae bacterium]
MVPRPGTATPGSPPMLRYWDGRLWTQHVAPLYPRLLPRWLPQRPRHPSGNGTCGTGSSRIWPCSSSSTCADALPS